VPPPRPGSPSHRSSAGVGLSLIVALGLCSCTLTPTESTPEPIGTTTTTTPTPLPTPRPTPDPERGEQPLLGQYNGNPNENPDQKFINTYGVAPQLTASYYTTQSVNITYETARVGRGTSVFMDLDSKYTPGLIAEVANQTPTGLQYIDQFLIAAEKVAAARRDDGTVYVAYVHEWEVKRAQNVLTNAQDRDPKVYARAHSVFNRRAAQIAPHVVPGYWIGGFSTNQDVVAQVMANMTVPAQWVATDPYQNNDLNATAVSTWLPKGVSFFKQNIDYREWGNPPIFLTEFGISTTLGDSAAAKFLTGLRQSMVEAGVAGAVHFNRDKTDVGSGLAVRYKIDNGTTPKALQAYKASMLAATQV
jgi:hypothetical protein